MPNRSVEWKEWRDNAIYVIACIVTLGLVYLIRIIITRGVYDAIVQRDVDKEHIKTKENARKI